MTRVSVCIPTYNGAAYIAAAVNSVLNQTFADFELIICDDASLDNTVEIAAGLRDERLRVVENPVRLGLVGNWNRCLTLATGEYIVVFHQDDLMYPDNLLQKVAFLDEHRDSAFVHSDIDCIDESDRVVGGHWASQPSQSLSMPGEEFFAQVSQAINPVACPAVMLRRACIETVGQFDDRFSFVVDLEMWLRLAEQRSVGYIAHKLVAHRLHMAQEGSRYRNTGRDALDMLRLLDHARASSQSPTTSRHIQNAYHALSKQSAGLARWQAQGGHMAAALRYWWVAIEARLRLWHRTGTVA